MPIGLYPFVPMLARYVIGDLYLISVKPDIITLSVVNISHALLCRGRPVPDWCPVEWGLPPVHALRARSCGHASRPFRPQLLSTLAISQHTAAVEDPASFTVTAVGAYTAALVCGLAARPIFTARHPGLLACHIRTVCVQGGRQEDRVAHNDTLEGKSRRRSWEDCGRLSCKNGRREWRRAVAVV